MRPAGRPHFSMHPKKVATLPLKDRL